MKVANGNIVLIQVFRQILGHALGQCGDQNPLLTADPFVNFRKQILDLGQGRPDFDLRINQSGRPHDLLDDSPGVFQLVGPRGGGNVDALRGARLELLELQRPVIQRRGQTETVIDQGFLA